MSTDNSASEVRSPKTTGKARSRLKKVRDLAAPHVAMAVAKTKRVGRRIAESVPAETKRGFDDGRQAGNNAVEAVPYGVGVVAGFVFGVGESIVNAAEYPVQCLSDWVASLWYGDSSEDENRVEVA